MKEFTRCTSCRGRKKIYGAGMIYRDCEKCGAVGWIEKEITEAEIHERVDADKALPEITASSPEATILTNESVIEPKKNFRKERGNKLVGNKYDGE